MMENLLTFAMEARIATKDWSGLSNFVEVSLALSVTKNVRFTSRHLSQELKAENLSPELWETAAQATVS